MSHVSRNTKKKYSPTEQAKILNERRWQNVKKKPNNDILERHFGFLNDAVVTRSGAEGIPLMTTTGIYGPILKNQTVRLNQSTASVVEVIPHQLPGKDSLLAELKKLKKRAKIPMENNSVIVQAKWISGKDGGGLPSVGSSSNVFGSTGSLLVNETDIDFPVLDIYHPDFEATLRYYGAKLLKPSEPFYMGFDKPLFGMEYDTRNPGYLQDYVMKSYGGGGLFVEHHPFPHIWFPNPDEAEKEANINRILLGRIIPKNEKQNKKINKDENRCLEIEGDPKKPEYHFTVFRIPSDGHALAVDECSIHNDSFCNGKQVVFLADTLANTVALRETAPFKNIRITEKETPHQ